jgi:hypothetical protein
MTSRRATAALAVFAACSLTLSAQQVPRQDGRWQVTMEMSGMPMQMPPITTEQCITPQDVANPEMLIPQAQGLGGQNAGCGVSDYKIAGNKVNWNMKCEGQMAMTGTGEMVYGENEYNGLMKMNMAAMNMDMTIKITGKRLGDCVK